MQVPCLIHPRSVPYRFVQLHRAVEANRILHLQVVSVGVRPVGAAHAARPHGHGIVVLLQPQDAVEQVHALLDGRVAVHDPRRESVAAAANLVRREPDPDLARACRDTLARTVTEQSALFAFEQLGLELARALSPRLPTARGEERYGYEAFDTARALQQTVTEPMALLDRPHGERQHVA